MRAWFGFVVAIAVGEAAALVWLARRGPSGDPLATGGSATVVVTQTVLLASGGSEAPGTPTAVDPAEQDPAVLHRRIAELERRIADLERQLVEQNRAFESIAPRLRETTVELDRVRRERDDLLRRAGRRSIRPDPRPGVPDAELTEAELRQRLEHLAALQDAEAWRAGDPVPEDALAGATEADHATVARVIADEEPRMLAALRGFVRGLPNAPTDLDRLPPTELLEMHVQPLLRDAFNRASQVSLQTLAKFQRGEIGLDDLLGAEHVAARLARVAANVRRDTWAELERAARPEHAAQIKQRHLRLGYYVYASGWQLVIGGASGY